MPKKQNKEHSLWVEKYRSKTLDEYVGNDDIKSKIKENIEANDIPHLIFSGTTGTGKTTLGKIVVKNLDCDYLYLNASDENGIETIREKVKGFASTATFKSLKVVLLDEADFLTQPAQSALRNLIEEYSFYTRFILTCNYIERIIEPLRSRCDIYFVNPPSKSAVAKHVCTNILDVEDIKYDMKDVVQIINEFYPDIRSIIKTLQSNSKSKELKITTLDDSWCKKLVKILESRDKKAWYTIRQLVADSEVDDFQVAYQYLFEHLDEFSHGNDAALSVILDEYSYRANVVPDKEINMMAAIAKILETIQKRVV